jgi:hypothetical protein
MLRLGSENPTAQQSRGSLIGLVENHVSWLSSDHLGPGIVETTKIIRLG